MIATLRTTRTRAVSAGLLAATAALLSACQDNPEPVAPTTDPSASIVAGPGILCWPYCTAAFNRVAFVRTLTDGGIQNTEIYSMYADGTGETRLTYNVESDGQPVFSPDRSKIAFVSYRTGKSELFVMNADGSNVKQLTSHAVQVTGPAWSPDGTRIAFTSSHVTPYGIFVINADGTGEKLLTNNYDNQPSFSPDGTKLVFVSSRGVTHQQHVFTMNADGTNQVQITPGYSGWQEMMPHWSPDGQRVVFVWYSYNDSMIYSMFANGDLNSLKMLVNSPKGDSYPSWSPDGSKIVFTSSRDATYPYYRNTIYTANADGSGQTRISPLTSTNSQSFWGR